MSGGSFCGSTYPYYQMHHFADELDHRIEHNRSEDEDGYYSHGLSDETLSYLRKQVVLLRRTSEVMRAIDYLYSGDHGEESFWSEIRKIDEAMREEEAEDRAMSETQRLRQTIEALVKDSNRLARERDVALKHVAMLRESLKAYYQECQCQRREMNEVNIQAYRALRETEPKE